MIPLINGTIRQQWQPVLIDTVIVSERRRELSDEHVSQIQASYEQLGGQLQLQPIVLDQDLVLIDGAHRLEAAKQAGWTHISALIFQGVNDTHRAIIETEANRVRKNLNPVELEAVWRQFYEPAYRIHAKRRQLAGLRRGRASPDGAETASAETANAAVSQPRAAMTLARAAKQTTGLSIDTLNKISDMRLLSQSQSVAPEVRQAALDSMQRLTRPHASVTSVHRNLMSVVQQSSSHEQASQQQRRRQLEKQLERVLDGALSLRRQVDGSCADELADAARCADSNQAMLRALRVSLAQTLAAVVVIECRLEVDTIAALKRIGAEVSKLQSATSASLLGLR